MSSRLYSAPFLNSDIENTIATKPRISASPSIPQLRQPPFSSPLTASLCPPIRSGPDHQTHRTRPPTYVRVGYQDLRLRNHACGNSGDMAMEIAAIG